MEVRLLQGAVDDLTDIKSSDKSWHTTKKAIQAELMAISKNPLACAAPPEVQDIVATQYRQGLTTYHRIIYEIVKNAIYVHIICHQRKGMMQILLRRVISIN
jgi:Txe/YoeB family toxin of Txe-Axe toxin-antitoxin module